MQAVQLPEPTPKDLKSVSASEKPIVNLVEKEENNLLKLETQIEEEVEEVAYEIKHYLVYAWHKVAMIILTIHSFIGVWESFQFIVFEYPAIEQQLSEGLIKEAHVNRIISGSALTFITTFITIAVAIRLHTVKEKTSVIVELILATILIITQQFFFDYLLDLDLLHFFQ